MTVSLPMPVYPPVTIITFPLRSGISSTENVGFGGKNWLNVDMTKRHGKLKV